MHKTSMGNGRIDISYQVSHCPKSLSFAENLQANCYFNGIEWRKETVDLSPYLGNEVLFKFVGYCGGGNNLYLDNINVYQKLSFTLKN